MGSDDFSWKDSEKDLVAEQSGLGISLIGLLLALFIGLAVRAVVDPEKVQAHLEKAISHIHPDLKITFKEAFVSFADGSLPDLAVVVRGGVISSDKKCWMAPLMEMNEIRLPLSWSHLARGEIYIHEILVDQVSLSLRNPTEKCTDTQVEKTPEKTDRQPSQFTAQPPPQKVEVTTFKNVRRKNPIDTLKIKTLKVHYLPIPFTGVQIDNFKLFLKSPEPRWFEVTGLLSLGGDALAGDFSSYANLKIDAIDGENASLAASAKGILREGHYNISLTAKPKADEFTFDMDMQHVPVSQIIPLLKKYRLLTSDITGKQAWISGKALMSGKTSALKQTPLNLQNVKLEGDLGEFSLAHTTIESAEPLRYKPMEFQIKNLNIKKFLEFLGKSHPTPTFGDLGNFSGTAVFTSPEDLRLRGDYSGLEFIFSNRGSRQIQSIGLISGELALKNNNWNLNLDRIKPVDGIFDGQVLVKADKDFKSVNIDAKLNELSLSPQVQILMTGGGSLGSINGRLQAEFDHARLKQLQGQVKWDQILIEGIRIYRPKLQLRTQQEEFLLDFTAQELEMQGSHPLTGSLFAPVTQIFSTDNSFLGKALSTKIRTKKLQELTWSSLQMSTSKGPLKSQGGWNSSGILSGNIYLPSQKLKWDLSGNRAQPQLVKANP